jgi:hypothetical protein
MKKVIQKIRAAKSWRERVEIAQDKLPGTFFDSVFKRRNLQRKWQPSISQLLDNAMNRWVNGWLRGF